MKLALVASLLCLLSAAYGKPSTAAPTKAKGTTRPTTAPTKAPTCPKQGKDFYIQIKILGQGDWSYEMTQVESQAFQDIREKLYDCSLQTYADYDFYQDMILLSIENATAGFVAGFAIRFTKEGDGHLNRLTQAIQSGKYCDVEVAPKFEHCSELDQTMLYPMANCPAPCGGDLNCWPTCDASCCGTQQTAEQTVYLPVAQPAPPPPPPPPPPMTMCASGCPETCAPSCSPTCCFVQKRWLDKQKNAMKPRQPYMSPSKKK
jgi:hypothetical protein